MTKAKESTIPVPVVLAIVAVLAGFALSHRTESGPPRHGTFVVSFQWNALPGGVAVQVTRNLTWIVGPWHPVRTESLRSPKVYRFPGMSTDHVIARAREITPAAGPLPTGFLFVSIIFHPDSGYPSLPKHQRDTSPVDLDGVRADWP